MTLYDDVEPILAGAASDISNVERITDGSAQTDALAYVLADLRDLKVLVSEVYATVEKRLLGSMTTGPKVEVPGLGLVVSHRKKSYKQWDHDEVFKALVARIADRPGVFYDPESGSTLPPAQSAANLVAALREAMSPSWKVTGIRAVGLDESEFCQVTPEGWSVELPPRNITERAA